MFFFVYVFSLFLGKIFFRWGREFWNVCLVIICFLLMCFIASMSLRCLICVFSKCVIISTFCPFMWRWKNSFVLTEIHDFLLFSSVTNQLTNKPNTWKRASSSPCFFVWWAHPLSREAVTGRIFSTVTIYPGGNR